MSKEFLDIQATIECGFTLERVRDMIRTYSQTELLMSKPVYIRLSILELSKMLIYEFWYDYVKPKYAKLRYMI